MRTRSGRRVVPEALGELDGIGVRRQAYVCRVLGAGTEAEQSGGLD
jgi:hypothetical protein